MTVVFINQVTLLEVVFNQLKQDIPSLEVIFTVNVPLTKSPKLYSDKTKNNHKLWWGSMQVLCHKLFKPTITHPSHEMGMVCSPTATGSPSSGSSSEVLLLPNPHAKESTH